MSFTTSLSPAELDALRNGFDATLLGADAATRFGDYKPGLGWLALALDVDKFVGIAAPQREQLVLAVMTARGSLRWQLAMHVYIGLCAGLSLDEIAGPILLASMYSGVDNYTGAMASAAAAVDLLKQLVQQGRAGTANVIPAIMALK